jgi:hypothetical protein
MQPVSSQCHLVVIVIVYSIMYIVWIYSIWCILHAHAYAHHCTLHIAQNALYNCSWLQLQLQILYTVTCTIFVILTITVTVTITSYKNTRNKQEARMRMKDDARSKKGHRSITNHQSRGHVGRGSYTVVYMYIGLPLSRINIVFEALK